ncbi:MATE family efflux transporter [Clostridium estertheticum]|uniref:MATE family efflux transporter n=1 Tax=Clostridium estertheticum TaxID=238834 RepID=UPI001C7D9265|nr:MATE family efflux transporter [Clostridium estertheticum]MBX4264777.1 MATE family efflux transporter [Clostridium estertheticum]MBX4269723.1 MATE family efflux transporter [Clostridium estertheticum]WLC77855.1 MATE family efflux transporter [Clostridium estertheticum]WLC88906.1 MATE family efflux transporter [Clostridium estertheticum]
MANKYTTNEVLNTSLPVVAEITIYTLMSIFDLMIIGRYGGNIAVSAVGLSNNLTNAFIEVFISGGFCISIVSLVSRLVGAGQYKNAERFASLGFILGIEFCLIITIVIFFFGKELLYLLGARNEILKIGYSYIKINSVGLFFFMSMRLLNSILIGYGNTFIPFLCSLIVLFIKIILNYLLVFGIVFNTRGIDGSAIASTVAYLCGFVFCFYYTVFKSQVKLKLVYIFSVSFNDIKRILVLAIPCSMEEAAFSISKLMCVSVIIKSGSVSFAADAIANMIEGISVMPSIGFGIAVITLVGINVGKRDYKEAKKVAFNCAFYAAAMMSIFAIIFLFMPNFLVDLFVNNNEKKVAYLAGKCLAIGAAEQPFIGLSLVFAGALKGIGDVKSPFLISCFTSWIIRLPLTYYFINVLNSSITAVWWITAFQWGVDALLMFIFFEYKFNKVAGVSNHISFYSE